jgi:hypothetical protein
MKKYKKLVVGAYMCLGMVAVTYALDVSPGVSAACAAAGDPGHPPVLGTNNPDFCCQNACAILNPLDLEEQGNCAALCESPA